MEAWQVILLEGVIISVVGTLLHFAYNWSRKNKRVGIIAAVNESTWEHTKIAIFPMFAAMFVDGFWWSEAPNYFVSKFLSVVAVMLLIPLLFYGYRLFSSKSILVIDIAIFYIAIFAGQGICYLMTTIPDLGTMWNFLALDGIFILFAVTLVLTFLPIKNFLFKDPITHKYGFGKK